MNFPSLTQEKYFYHYTFAITVCHKMLQMKISDFVFRVGCHRIAHSAELHVMKKYFRTHLHIDIQFSSQIL